MQATYSLFCSCNEDTRCPSFLLLGEVLQEGQCSIGQRQDKSLDHFYCPFDYLECGFDRDNQVALWILQLVLQAAVQKDWALQRLLSSGTLGFKESLDITTGGDHSKMHEDSRDKKRYS